MNNTFQDNVGFKTPGNFMSTDQISKLHYGIDRNKISDEYEYQNYPYFFKAVQP